MQKAALQGAAVLILMRLCTLLCSDAPFTAGRACGLFAAALIQTALLLPLICRPQKMQLSAPVLALCRADALLLAARQIVLLWRLLADTNAPHPVWTMLLLAVILCDLLRLSPAAPKRAAVLLLLTFCGAMLLLLPRTLSHAAMLPLYVSADPADGLREGLLLLAEIPLIPLLAAEQSPQANARMLRLWTAACTGFFPMLVLLCAALSGRLQRYPGNHFFLLLSRLPLSDAIRTDGFWLLFLVMCCTLSAYAALSALRGRAQS